MIEALVARELVTANPDLSINQFVKRKGCCRKQLTRLVRLIWLSLTSSRHSLKAKPKRIYLARTCLISTCLYPGQIRKSSLDSLTEPYESNYR